MSDSTLYDDDIYAWSKQQAEALREFARRDASNRVDWEHVIEEIDDVGGNQLRAVESMLRQLFIHLMKAASDPSADAIDHWAGEIIGFQGQMERDYRPSMRQNVDLAWAWRQARKETAGLLRSHKRALSPSIPDLCPFALDELLADDFDVDAAVARLLPSHPDAERG
jgi:hypothetical protein